MKETLRRPWGDFPAGTVISTEAEEGETPVNERRFEALREGGFFAPAVAAKSKRTSEGPGPAPEAEEATDGR